MARKASQRREHFVADGRERAAAGELPRIRCEVEAKYAPQWAASGFLGRLWLRLKIHREVQRELETVAPRDGLYAKR